MNGGVGFGWFAGVVFIFRMRCYVCFGTVWRLKDFTRSLLSLSFGIHGRPTRLGRDWPSGLAGEACPPRQLNSHVFFWRAKNGCSTPHEHAHSQTCTHMCSGKRARISSSTVSFLSQSGLHLQVSYPLLLPIQSSTMTAPCIATTHATLTRGCSDSSSRHSTRIFSEHRAVFFGAAVLVWDS